MYPVEASHTPFLVSHSDCSHNARLRSGSHNRTYLNVTGQHQYGA